MATPSKNFSYAVEQGVAVITFDIEGEPVNTISPQISTDFESLMTKAASDVSGCSRPRRSTSFCSPSQREGSA